ncbi:MAG: hypothetical protein ACTHK8_03615 [Ginsengibacter sp.]
MAKRKCAFPLLRVIAKKKAIIAVKKVADSRPFVMEDKSAWRIAVSSVANPLQTSLLFAEKRFIFLLEACSAFAGTPAKLFILNLIGQDESMTSSIAAIANKCEAVLFILFGLLLSMEAAKLLLLFLRRNYNRHVYVFLTKSEVNVQ